VGTAWISNGDDNAPEGKIGLVNVCRGIVAIAFKLLPSVPTLSNSLAPVSTAIILFPSTRREKGLLPKIFAT
jgi:hypothetical protein